MLPDLNGPLQAVLEREPFVQNIVFNYHPDKTTSYLQARLARALDCWGIAPDATVQYANIQVTNTL